ncbi:MAG TPA: hypothetical protein VF627_06260 [Abditibacterium sp.]|jgi:hypothetical protein
MSNLKISQHLLVLSLLAASNLQPSFAQDAPTPNAPAETRPPRAEGRGEGGPRGGGPNRGEGPRPNETGEQFRERMVAPYLEMVPDLSDDQKTHILAIIEAANAEASAVRNNKTLSPERQRAATRGIRGEIPNRVKSALTEAQLPPYQALLDEQAATAAEMNQVGTARPGEDLEQMRQRVLKGYEAVLEELSVKQKTAIIKILENAGEATAKIDADSTQTAAQKSAAKLQIHDSVNTQVLPLLDADQKKTWKIAHDAKRAALG